MNIPEDQQYSDEFERWWYNEGSGERPTLNEDIEEFAHRITSIAWANGAYAALNSQSETIIPNQ